MTTGLCAVEGPLRAHPKDGTLGGDAAMGHARAHVPR